MSCLSQACLLGYTSSPQQAFQGDAAHQAQRCPWLTPKDSSGTWYTRWDYRSRWTLRPCHRTVFTAHPWISLPNPIRRLLHCTFDDKSALYRRIPDPLAIVELDVIEAVSVDVFENKLRKSAPRVAVSGRACSIIIVGIPKARRRWRSAESGDRRRHRLRRPLDKLQGIRVRVVFQKWR